LIRTIANYVDAFIPVKRPWRAFRAAWNARQAPITREEWWKTILSSDGLLHWEDLKFDLRHEPNTLFIRDEILNSGEYDFRTHKPCVVLDIGMNIGDTPLYFARMPNVHKIYGFEPIRATYEWAVSNFKLNPAFSSKIVPACAAISDKTETIEIDMDYQDGTGGAAIDIVNADHQKVIERADYILKAGAPKRKQEIRVENASDVVRGILKDHSAEALVVKCDAEGAEWKIIPTLDEDGLLQEIAILMLEYHYKAPTDLLEMLTNAGFVCFLRDLKHIKHSEIGNIYAVNSRSV